MSLSDRKRARERPAGSEAWKQAVRARFEGIAPVYDRANRLFSLGLDRRWRRVAVRTLDLKPGEAVLDVCGGTGDLAFLASGKIGSNGRAVVCDFSRRMLEAGKRRHLRGPREPSGEMRPQAMECSGALRRLRSAPGLRWVQGDAERLCFADGSFDAVTAGFGIRNLADRDCGLAEMARVLRPGGRALVLEFSLPRHPLLRRLYDAYAFGIMPLQARLVYGDDRPLRYLTASIRAFPPPPEVAAAMARAGFGGVRTRRLSGGIVTMYLAWKPGASELWQADPPVRCPLRDNVCRFRSERAERYLRQPHSNHTSDALVGRAFFLDFPLRSE